MKNLFKGALLAAFAMAFAACSNDATEDVTPVNPEVGTKTITVSVDAAMTRTTLNDGRTGLQWENGDKFGYFANGTDAAANTAVEYTEGATEYTMTVPTDATEIYAYYPHSTYNDSKTASTITLGMGNQNPEAGGVFDGYYYPMVAKATIVDNKATLEFKPIASAIAFNVYNTAADYAGGEQVKSIKLTSSKIGGYPTYDLTYQKMTGEPSYSSLTVTLPEGDYVTVGKEKPTGTKMADNQIYLMLHKGTYTNATIVVTTDVNTYTFEGANLDCTKDIVAMNLNLSKGTVPSAKVEADLADGVYAIMAVSTDGKYYAVSSAPNATTTRRDRYEVTYDGEATEFNVPSETLMWTLTKVTDGYTIKYGNEYLSYDSNKAPLSSNEYVVKIYENNGVYEIYANDEKNRLAMNGTYGFGFYASTQTYPNAQYIVPAKDVRTKLDAPATVTAVLKAETDNTATVTWSEVVNADSYIVTYAYTDTATSEEVAKTVTIAAPALSADIENLKYATVYSFSVVATGVGYLDSDATKAANTVTTLAEPEGVKTATLSFAGGDSKNHDPLTFTDDASGISAVFTAGTHSTKPRWDATCVRFYGTNGQQNSLTVSGTNVTITKIVFTMNGSYAMNGMTANSGTLDANACTWTGSASSVEFTAGTAQTRFEGVEVTYTTTSN